jgi:hypothetical protein
METDNVSRRQQPDKSAKKSYPLYPLILLQKYFFLQWQDVPHPPYSFYEAFASGLFSRSLEDLVIIYFWIAIISGKHND